MAKKPQFTLSHKSAILAKFDPKSVHHGKERGSLVDIKMVYKAKTDVLAHFHPNLRAHFFKQADIADQVELVDKSDLLTALRYPQIKSMKWDQTQTGCTFVIHRGVSDLTMTECEVHKFVLSFQEGGNVIVQFVVRARPTIDQAGIIYDLIMHDLDVSLSASSQEELDV